MRKSMTFGTMPSREDFDAACADHDPEDPPEACVANLGFRFGNDPRLGNDTLTPDELWKELQKAFAEYQAVDGSSDDGGAPERAGDWCSSVLGQLGFEWI